MTGEPLTDAVTLHVGDCREVLASADVQADAIVSDPPYELGFMGKSWDRSGVAFDPATWATVMRAVKPGGYLLAFAGSRTQHRVGVAIEDGGWEIRDCLLWLYGQGMPKGKGCLKPAYEPIILARRPGPKVLPLGVAECAIPTADNLSNGVVSSVAKPGFDSRFKTVRTGGKLPGRYPANVLHDGSDEVLEVFAAFGESKPKTARTGVKGGSPCHQGRFKTTTVATWPADTGGTAARFFYAAKASKAERGPGNMHPTVKPLALMRWLVRLVCPPGGTVLDPFAGSGTTGIAAVQEGRRAVLIEQSEQYAGIIRKRLKPQRAELFA